MKKIKNCLIVLFTFIIVILLFFLVRNIKNNKNTSQNDKLISEINFMDSKLTSLLNRVNNITFENYKIIATKTNTSKKSNSSSESNTETNSSLESKESTDGQNSEEKTSNDVTEQYGLHPDGVLTGNNNIDWIKIKSEVETLYAIIPTMTLDLYNKNINQEDILNFNKELDELMIAIKNEDKNNTLIKLANLYRYLPAYASNFSDNLNYISLLETKSNIFNSYVFVNIEDWEKALEYTNKSIESFSRALNNIENNRNFDTNKIYIILNEMQNAVNIKDRDIFLIKYKNFVEETNKQSK